MATSQFSPFGLAPGPGYVMTPAAWTALPARTSGFGPGLLPKENINTALRQSSSIATMIANFIAANQASDVLDDGNLVALQAQFSNALLSAIPSDIQVNVVGTSGQIKFPAAVPLTIKWGYTPTYGTDSGNTFSFPALGAVPGPFPTACFGAVLTAANNVGVGSGERYSYCTNNVTPSGFQVINDGAINLFFYLAIGY